MTFTTTPVEIVQMSWRCEEFQRRHADSDVGRVDTAIGRSSAPMFRYSGRNGPGLAMSRLLKVQKEMETIVVATTKGSDVNEVTLCNIHD